MRFSQSAQATLINWLHLFDFGKNVASIEALGDGLVFSQLLQDMDPAYEPADLNPDASTWLERKHNLESVFKSLDKYLCVPSGGDNELDWLPRTYNPKEIARATDIDGLCEALGVFLFAAMSGPKASKYVPDIQNKLGKNDHAQLAAIFKQKEAQKDAVLAAAGVNHTIEQDSKLRDRELEFEEERAKLRAQNDSLMKQNADLLTRLERLQAANEDLKETGGKLREEVEEARKLQSGNHDAIIMKLEERAREQEDLISQQEHQIEEDRLAKLRLGAELAQLSQQAAKLTELQDEVSELRHVNEELSKKANAAERYKQKLESQHGIEKDLKNMQYELEEARKDQAGYERLKLQVESQAVTISSYRRIQEDTELQLSDIREQKNHVSELLSAKSQELDRMVAQRSLDEKMINELREQITSNGFVHSSPSPEPEIAKTELNGEDAVVGLKLELSKLKAENSLLRNNMGVASVNEQLRAELDLSKRNETRLTEKLHELRKDLVVSQDQIQATMNQMTDEGSQAYFELQKHLLQATTELSSEKERARRLEAEFKDTSRELLALRTDYKVATKDSIDALQELKSTDHMISTSLRDELESLRKAHEGLQLDLKEQQTQLIDALVSRERLRKELEDAASKEGPAIDPAVADLDRQTSNELAQKQAEKIEKLRVAVQNMKEQLQKADQERYELQRRLKATEQGGAYAALKAANDQTIKNLQRENAMISTAWYDLTSRLQSNHVVLQRRQDMPKSWLNKQRQMVNATPRR